MKFYFNFWIITLAIFFFIVIANMGDQEWDTFSTSVLITDILAGIFAFLAFAISVFRKYYNKISWSSLFGYIFFLVLIFSPLLFSDNESRSNEGAENYIQTDFTEMETFERNDNYSKERDYETTGDLDCDDFYDQNEAQDFFESEGGPDQDFHNLDRDGDGIACE